MATVKEFLHEDIQGANACKSFRGFVTAVKTYHGNEVIIMAATRTKLVDVIKELNPSTVVDPSKFFLANILDHGYVVQKYEEF